MFSVINGVPVDATEEGVLLYSRRAAADVTEASGPVDRAELPDEVFGFVADVRFLGEDDGLFDDSGGCQCQCCGILEVRK